MTDPHRDYLAYLTVITLRPQLKREHSWDDLCDALGDIADAGDVKLLGDQENIYVFISGRLIVHAARDWLDAAVAREQARPNN